MVDITQTLSTPNFSTRKITAAYVLFYSVPYPSDDLFQFNQPHSQIIHSLYRLGLYIQRTPIPLYCVSFFFITFFYYHIYNFISIPINLQARLNVRMLQTIHSVNSSSRLAVMMSKFYTWIIIYFAYANKSTHFQKNRINQQLLTFSCSIGLVGLTNPVITPQ